MILNRSRDTIEISSMMMTSEARMSIALTDLLDLLRSGITVDEEFAEGSSTGILNSLWHVKPDGKSEAATPV